MFFSSNKIKKSIRNNSSNENSPIDSEFESLASIRKKQKDKRIFHRLFVNTYHDAILNIKEKKERTVTFFKTKYHFLVLLLFICFFIALFISLGYATFLPFEFKFIGNVSTSLTNFYYAKDGSISGLTTLGYLIIVFLVLMIISGIFVFKWYKSKLIINANKITKILSIVSYVVICLLILAMLLIVFIPPEIYRQENYQEIYNFRTKIANAETDGEKISLINQLDNFIKSNGLNIPLISSYTGTSLIGKYENWNVDFGFLLPSLIGDYSLLYNSNFSLTPVGIAIIVLFSTFGISFMILVPIGMLLFSWIKEIRFDLVNEDIKKNYNFVKNIIYNIMYRLNDFSLRKMKDIKDKESYHRYKKRLNKQGRSTVKNDELFNSNVKKEQLVLNQEEKMREEFLKNQPNVAFLSSNGRWMYHDGNNNFFVARGDEWIPFDISKEIHKAHSNLVDENLNFSPSEKKVKESRINIGKKKENDITIPDQEIDDIVKSLNI